MTEEDEIDKILKEINDDRTLIFWFVIIITIFIILL